MRRDFQVEYRSILDDYVAGAGESASLRAYEFARQCLREGLAPDDVVAFHVDAASALPPETAARAQALLLDVVMAFSLSYQHALRELENANQELEKLSSFKSRMLSMVAHDMMNHLVATKMLATSMKREVAGTPRLAPRVDNLLAIVDDQEQLIQNLLDLGRIESGRLALDLEEVDLSRLIDRAVVKAQSSSAVHSFTVTGPKVKVPGDRGKLQQVLDNLIGNAVKYSPQGGVVEIAVTQNNGQVEVAVRDQGVGIARDDLPHVFEPFYRGKTGHADIRGTGLGLSIVQSLVKMHEGTLSVESESGRGSTFRVTLPAVHAPHTVPQLS